MLCALFERVLTSMPSYEVEAIVGHEFRGRGKVCAKLA